MGAKRGRLVLLGIATFALTSFLAFRSAALEVPSRAAESRLAARAQPIDTSVANQPPGIAIGKPLHLILEFGEQYVDGDELYDAHITVVKVLRGALAAALVKSASASNPSAESGFEYVAAFVRFDFSARVVPEHYDYTIDPAQFSSISADGAAHPAPKLIAQPKPSLRGTLHSGDSIEGWVVLLAPRSDHTPLMLFVPNTGTTSHQGGSSVFRLYSVAALGGGEKSS